MPVYRTAEGGLAVSLAYPKGLRPNADQVWAGSAESGVFETCKSMAQHPVWQDYTCNTVAEVPVKVLERYGSSDTVAAFALLGWLRGRELTTLDEESPKVKITDRYVTPRRKRTFWLSNGMVYENGKPVATYDGTKAPVPAPAGGPVQKPRAPKAPSAPSTPKVAEPAGPMADVSPEHVIMTKDSLTRLSPEARAYFRNMADHQWAGRTVAAVQRMLRHRKSPWAKDVADQLYRLCTVPASTLPLEGVDLASL